MKLQPVELPCRHRLDAARSTIPSCKAYLLPFLKTARTPGRPWARGTAPSTTAASNDSSGSHGVHHSYTSASQAHHHSHHPDLSHHTTNHQHNSSHPNEHGPESINSAHGFQLKLIHIVVFSLVFVGGALFATLGLTLTAEMKFGQAVSTVLRRVARSVAFRQLVVIAGSILVLRYGLNNFLSAISTFSSSPIHWDKTKLYYVMREVYQPLELLLFIAALCTMADSFVPPLIAVPKATVTHVVKCIMSSSFILGFASVVFNLKSRFCKENAWQAEMKGDVTTQRRWEAYDKMGSIIIYVMTFVLGIQSIGLEVTSVLAIGGIGGLAIGLAGREICENLLNGFLIMSTNPFEVGDEVIFFQNSKMVEGFVIDIGWYRTLIRSFEREVYVIPNAVFSRNIVLNVTRKNREFRFFEQLMIRVEDVHKANAIVQDIRRIVRNDTRVINKLHRRIFLDKVTPTDARIYLSFYLEAANKDAFMAIKQDLLLAFVDCVERNGAKLALPRTMLDMDSDTASMLGSANPLVQGASALAVAQAMAQAQAQAGLASRHLGPSPLHPTDMAAVPQGGLGGPGGGVSSGPMPGGQHPPAPGFVGAPHSGLGAAGLGAPGFVLMPGMTGSPSASPERFTEGGSKARGYPSALPQSGQPGGPGPEVKVVAAGGKVGDVYTATAVGGVVTVPVHAPVAYAGGPPTSPATMAVASSSVQPPKPPMHPPSPHASSSGSWGGGGGGGRGGAMGPAAVRATGSSAANNGPLIPTTGHGLLQQGEDAMSTGVPAYDSIDLVLPGQPTHPHSMILASFEECDECEEFGDE